LGFDTVSDPVLRAFLWAGLASVAASAGMLLAVLLVRLRNRLLQTHEQAVAARWQGILLRCVEELPAPLPALRRADGYLFLRLWNRIHESLRGEAHERLNELALRLGADALAVRYLRSHDPRRELLGIVTLGNLRLPGAGKAVDRLIEHRSPVVSLRAAQALMRIAPWKGLPRLLYVAARRADWPIARVIALLREAPAERTGEALAKAIERSLAAPRASERLPRLLKLIDAASAETVRPALLRAMKRHPDSETLAAGLAALRHPEDVALARRYARHEAWHVRLEAAKALGRLGGREDLPRLVSLLADRSWWVRHRAAQAIAALPWLKPQELQRLADTVSDRFAADALRESIAERGGS
jgi:hypothetical protein